MFSGFEIPMNHAVPMRIIQRARDCRCDAYRLVDRQLRFALQPSAQTFPFHEGHDVEQQPRAFARIEERQEVGMLQVRRDADLA